MATIRNTLILAVAGILAATLGLLAPVTALAAPEKEGTPTIDLSKAQPAHALIGTQQEVTLTASNPAGQVRGYNLSFRDVLPKGVRFVPGTGSIEPSRVIGDPEKEATTLIFENVSDLSANSEFGLHFKLEPLEEFFAISKTHEYTDQAEAFVTEKPRSKATFDPEGKVVAKSFSGRASAEATTELTAVEIIKSEPSPEGEIPRGVHDHQVVYTLTVKNNEIGPTSNLEVEDLLPAGLEFLGCGNVENTTATKTNPTSKEEYPGAGELKGHAPTGKEEATACPLHEPFLVETVENPAGHPPGVYTLVKWKELPELQAGDEFQIQYVAAIPILRNAMTWEDGIEPSPESLEQAANLDNNTGLETKDEEELTNFSRVQGEYEEEEVEDTDELTRTAEDLAIQKTVDKKEIEEEEESVWTLDLETSEYRFVNGVKIKDVLPNGLCPLGNKGYEKPDGTPVAKTAECEGKAGVAPTYEIAGVTLAPQPAEYSSIKYLANGSFEIFFDESAFADGLAQMGPNEHLILKIPTKTRTFYQENYEPSGPVLTKDSWTNKVQTEGDDFAICAPADPLCTAPAPAKIFTEEPEGTPDEDASEAGQEAGGIEIDKTVRENKGTVPANCSEGSEYVEGTGASLPLYSPGDEICWNLRVKFAANLFSGEPIVTDFVPPDEEFVPGSATKAVPPLGENTLEAAFTESFEGEKEALQWTLEKSVKSGTQIFEWRFRTKLRKEPENKPVQVSGNLMKFVYSNTIGQTFPLRDRAEVRREEPELELEKGVIKVGSKVPVDAPATGVIVGGGEVVTYELNVVNKGNEAAEEAEVWDVLPEGIECADLVGTHPTCDAATRTLKFTGVAIAAGGSTPLTYEVKVPTDVAPEHAFINHAGVARYFTPTNTGGKFEYVPTENINPEAENENTKPILAEAEIITAEAELEKEATTETNQPGNEGPQATIGEIIDYKVTATIPANSKLFGSPKLTDELPPTLEFIPGSAGAELDGGALSGGLALVELAAGAEVEFPKEFDAGIKAHTVVLTMKARVLNTSENVRGDTVNNRAQLNYEDVGNVPRELSKEVPTALVEPQLAIKKKVLTNAGSTKVRPGELVEYEAEIGNSGSTANEVEVIDTAPPGMKVASPGSEGEKLSNTEIRWKFKTVAPGETKKVTYTLEVEEPAIAASAFTNKIVATTQSLPDEAGGTLAPETRTAGFVEGAYEASAHGYEKEATNTVNLIGAEVTKQVDLGEGTIGKELTYTLHMKLPPQIKFFNTTVVDTLPSGIEFDKLLSAKCVEGCPPGIEGEELPTVEQGGSRFLGWYFGNFAAQPAERDLEIKFTAFISDDKRGGGEVKAPEAEVNKVIGLYNDEDQGKPAKTPTPGPGDGFSEPTNEATAETKVLEPSLELEKSVSGNPALGAGTPPIVQPGTTLTYTLAVTNNGSSTAYETEVTDDIATANLRDITPVQGASLVTSAPGAPLAWTIPEIEAGETVTLTYTAEPLPSEEITGGEEIENQAAVAHYFGLPEPEREAAKAKREYTGPGKTKNLEVEVPLFEIEKTTGAPGFPGSAPAEVGVPFKWRVVVKNNAAVAGAKGAFVEDVLPAGWEYVSGSTTFAAQGGAIISPTAGEPDQTPGAHQVLVWENIAELPAGAAVEVLFEATPTLKAAEAESGLVPNVAFAHFEDLSGAERSGSGSYSGEAEAKAEVLLPELTIEKTPDGGHTIAGTHDHYDIQVKNEGSGPAHEVEVKDVLGPDQEFAAPARSTPPFAAEQVETDTPGTGETTVVWTFAEIPAGGEIGIEVPILSSHSLEDGEEITDLASVTSPQAPATPPDEGSFIVERVADLAIHKSAEPARVNAGETIKYKLDVENIGPSDATGVEVTDPLPTGTAVVTAGLPPRCSATVGEITCVIGDLTAGTGTTVEFELEVSSATITEVANVATVKGDQPDPDHSNDSSEVKTMIGAVADLAIHKSGPAQPVLLGNTFQYTLEVENRGPSDAVAVEVEDALPAQVEFLEATTSAGVCDSAPAGVLTCEIGNLVARGPTVMITVTVRAAEVGDFENEATVDSPTADEELENNHSKAPAEVLPAADLAITKTAPATVEPDGELTYGLHVENLGPSTAHHVVVSDPLPAGVEFVKAGEGCAAASGVVTCEVAGGELEPNGAADFQVTVHVPFNLGGQPLTNTASVSADEGDPHPENNSSTVTTEVGPAADLSITKTMGKAQAGRPLTYTLAIANHGPSDSTAVTVKDALPDGTTFKSAAPSQGACSASGQSVICRLGALAAGGSAQVSITVDVAAAATGTLRNVATVEGPEPDPDKSNNESAVEGPVDPVPPLAPNLRVVKSADTSSPLIGTPFDYHVAVTNLSGGEAKNVKVLDTLNGPVKVLSIESESGHCGAAGSRITCTIPSIAVGKTVQITYSVVAEATGALSNTASAQAANGEVAPANNHAVKSVKAKAAPKATYSLTKTASRKVVAGGKKVGFTITLRNGRAALTKAKICDRLPAALVFVKAAGARFVNGEACWQKNFIAPHKILRLHLTARALKGDKSRRARNVATASAKNARERSAAATVRIKSAFSGAPGGVTG